MTDSYLGSKGASGLAEWHVNMAPVHHTLIVPFAGHCKFSQRIAPCDRLILCDRDTDVLDWWETSGNLPDHGELHECCGLEFLSHYFQLSRRPEVRNAEHSDTAGNNAEHGGVLVYSDSPYHPDTRTSDKRYKFELTIEGHRQLRSVMRSLPCPVMVCGYPHHSYDVDFSDWKREERQAMTHGGLRTEVVWRNFEPIRLHDYRWLGSGYREREKLSRRERRMMAKLEQLPAKERARFLSQVVDHFPADFSGPAATLISERLEPRPFQRCEDEPAPVDVLPGQLALFDEQKA